MHCKSVWPLLFHARAEYNTAQQQSALSALRPSPPSHTPAPAARHVLNECMNESAKWPQTIGRGPAQ